MTPRTAPATSRMPSAECSPATFAPTLDGSPPAPPVSSLTWSGWGCTDGRPRPLDSHARYLHSFGGSAAGAAAAATRARHSLVRAHRLAAHVCALPAPPRALRTRPGRIPVRSGCPLDSRAEHSLPPRPRWHFAVAGSADHISYTALRLDLLALH